MNPQFAHSILYPILHPFYPPYIFRYRNILSVFVGRDCNLISLATSSEESVLFSDIALGFGFDESLSVIFLFLVYFAIFFLLFSLIFSLCFVFFIILFKLCILKIFFYKKNLKLLPILLAYRL